MTIRQLSVFLENKPGYLNEALAVLARYNVNINALTIADTSDYGLARILVSDPQLAKLISPSSMCTLSVSVLNPFWFSAPITVKRLWN